jgi:diphthine synthase
MGELVFVGLGLHDEKGISLSGLEEAKAAEEIFLELYTNFMPNFSIEKFAEILGKKIHVVSRRQLEEENGKTRFGNCKKR